MEGFAVVERFPMHWGDMDALGHANNVRFFTWFETARIAYFRRVGLVPSQSNTIGPILARATCDFLRQLEYPKTLLAATRVPRIGNTSFTMEYVVADADDPSIEFARGEGVIVVFDYAAQKKVRVPDDVRKAIAELDGLAEEPPTT